MSISNDYLEFKNALLEYGALCRDHPNETLWQEHIFKRIDTLFKKYYKEGK